MILPRLIKSILCLQNGNAAVERSMSDNKNTIAPESEAIGRTNVDH